jgi:alpha-1,2-mannosyltransferase
MMREGKGKVGPIVVAMVAVGLFAVMTLLALDLANAAHRPRWSINGDVIWGRDFVNLWSAGRLAIEHELAILYDIDAYQAWQQGQFGPIIVEHNYSYPPPSLFYAPLFGALPYGTALILFLGLSLVAFYAAVRPWLARVGLSGWWSLVLPSTWLCLWAGHYGLVIGALWCAAWTALDRYPGRAGSITGLMIVKPHLAVAMPILLVGRHAWHAILAAAATVILIVAASLIVFGPSLWETYLTATAALQLKIIGQTTSYSGLMMPTVAAALRAYGTSEGAAFAAQLLVAAATCGMLLWRTPADAIRAGALGAVATFLILPYVFNYDMTVFGLAALMFAVDAGQQRRHVDVVIAGLALALPPATMFLSLYGLRIAPLVVAALFVRMWQCWADRPFTLRPVPSAASSPPSS